MDLVVLLKVGFILLVLNCCACDNETPHKNDRPILVDTKLGKVEGVILKSIQGKPFNAFRGIPYAKPPIKDLRFRPPVPIERWEHILDATEDGHRCLQIDVLRGGITGDEDCLLLNVYSPELKPSILRPVMVFIHGGGFAFGDGRSDMYGPERLLDKDIVLVTFNYRLSALGFLSTADAAAPGNQGFLDQVQALQWVRDNVAAFGGDPRRVTIFGESAGGASVVFHLLSPLSKGLFHAAISQSGTALSEWAVQPRSSMIQSTKQLAESLKCPTENSQAIVQCLRRRAAVDIAARGNTFDDSGPIKKTQLLFMAVVDKGFGGMEFLPKEPMHLTKTGEINTVPVLIGQCKDEGYIILKTFAGRMNGINNVSGEDISNDFKNDPLLSPIGKKYNVEKIATEYLSQVDPADASEWIKVLINIYGDVVFGEGIAKTIVELADNDVPTYVYKFSHKGQHSLIAMTATQEIEKEYIEKMKIVSHFDEMQYLFKLGIQSQIDMNEEDNKMADIMITVWTNFAKNRVPSFEGSSIAHDVTFEWNTVEANRPSYVDLNLQPAIRSGSLCSRPDLWQKEKFKDEL